MSNQIVLSQPAELVRQSTDIAQLCKSIVVASALDIQGRKYVRVEGWQSIATAHGCLASSRDVERVEGGYRAIGEVRRMSDGALLAQAEGFVGEDEPTWFGGEVTSYGKTKTLPKRPDYAIRAMCQTRAISRACRSAFAHVVVLMDAGLSTTPAEEVPQGGFNDDPHAESKGDERITDDLVPQKYWQMKANNGTEEANKWLAAQYGASHAVPRKIGKDWRIVVFGEVRPVEGTVEVVRDGVKAESPHDYTQTRIHFGTNTGLTLAELSPHQRKWLMETWLPKKHAPDARNSQQDVALMEAVQWYADKAGFKVPGDTRQAPEGTPAGSTLQTGSWKALIVHVAHPAKGATLGELPLAQRDELRAIMDNKAKIGTKNLSATDKKLIAALAMELGERKPASDPDDEIPMFNGPNHQKLHDALVFAEISEDDFMATARDAKWIPQDRTSFAEMSDETAKGFLGDMENLQDAVCIYLDKRKASKA